MLPTVLIAKQSVEEQFQVQKLRHLKLRECSQREEFASNSVSVAHQLQKSINAMRPTIRKNNHNHKDLHCMLEY